MHQKRIYIEKTQVKVPEGGLRLAFPGDGVKPLRVDLKTTMVRARVDQQPTPVHDYLNFKKMTGNEILLNLENNENLINSELVSGLIELGKRDTKREHNWNLHPTSAKCLADFKKRLPGMASRHVLQASLFMQLLRVEDKDFWQEVAGHTLRMLHKYKDSELAFLLYQFDRELLDKEGE
jgi:hypothetical protein